jgi:sarcosine oxidase
VADTEVVVVGAGVMGLATAHALALAGRDVVVLERFEVGHDRGSSHGSSRIFRLSYPDAGWVRLCQEALPLWLQLEAEAGETLLERRGTVDLGDWEPNRTALAQAGAAHALLGADELRRRFGLNAGAGERALWQPDGGIVHAERAQRALAAGAAGHGALLVEGARVESLAPAPDGVAVDAGESGSYTARAVVVTAGAWASELLTPLGIELRVSVTRETVSYYGHDAGEEPLPSVIEIANAQEPAYALAAPGVGVKAGLHHTGAAAAPDDPGAPDGAIAARTAAWVERRFAEATPLGRAETCLYTTTEDEGFVLERHGRVVVGSPCSGHGFKFAPVIGRRLAELVAAAD